MFPMKRKALYGSILIPFGIMYLLASPGFSATPEPQFEQAKQIKILVDKAAALVESKGKDAFPEFKKKDSEWYKGETYIFVYDMNGISLMHPVNPELEGKNLTNMKDANGKLWMQEFIETAKTRGSGWVDYTWSKPGEDQPSNKISYIKKARMPDGEMVILGAGIYTFYPVHFRNNIN